MSHTNVVALSDHLKNNLKNKKNIDSILHCIDVRSNQLFKIHALINLPTS